ncbi:hypothetical protein AB0N88_29620 [Streptomyces sp. NPDC093516]|uniref:hypothetical protein n=1 Tax=Streptomyces sp. NPDC093516 TaxID=3155304 RepID=UPI0034280083
MARWDRARRWARWPAARRWWHHGVRWLLPAVVAVTLGVVCAACGLPRWTLYVCLLLVLIMDDAVGGHMKRRSAEPDPGDEKTSG